MQTLQPLQEKVFSATVKYKAGKPVETQHYGTRINAKAILDDTNEEIDLWANPDDPGLLSLYKKQKILVVKRKKSWFLADENSSENEEPTHQQLILPVNYQAAPQPAKPQYQTQQTYQPQPQYKAPAKAHLYPSPSKSQEQNGNGNGQSSPSKEQEFDREVLDRKIKAQAQVYQCCLTNAIEQCGHIVETEEGRVAIANAIFQQVLKD